jgi:hypothetical protein
MGAAIHSIVALTLQLPELSSAALKDNFLTNRNFSAGPPELRFLGLLSLD